MKQTETHKKETHIHCLFTSSRFIIPEENPGIYPCIKIFSYGLSTQDHGQGGGGGEGESHCKKSVTSLVCFLHFTEPEQVNLLRDRAYDLFVIPDISKIKQIIN